MSIVGFGLELFIILFAWAIPLVAIVSKVSHKIYYSFVSLSFTVFALIIELQKYSNYAVKDDITGILDVFPTMTSFYYVFVSVSVILNAILLFKVKSEITFKEVFIFVSYVLYLIVICYDIYTYKTLVISEDYPKITATFLSIMKNYFRCFVSLVFINGIILVTYTRKNTRIKED